MAGWQVPVWAAEVPFSHAHGFGAEAFEHDGDGDFRFFQTTSAVGKEHRWHASSNALAPGEKRRARRRTDRICRAELAEADTFPGHPVQIGSLDLGTVATQITVLG